MGEDGQAGGHCRIKGAEVGPGGLHSRRVGGFQGQLQGAAEQAAKVEAASGSIGHVALKKAMAGLATWSYQAGAGQAQGGEFWQRPGAATCPGRRAGVLGQPAVEAVGGGPGGKRGHTGQASSLQVEEVSMVVRGGGDVADHPGAALQKGAGRPCPGGGCWQALAVEGVDPGGQM